MRLRAVWSASVIGCLFTLTWTVDAPAAHLEARSASRAELRDDSRHAAAVASIAPLLAADPHQPEAPSITTRLLLGAYCALIFGASLFGGWLPQRFATSHTQTQTVISLIAGLMLSIGIFHMLPHAVAELGEEGFDNAAYGLMAGLVVMFLLLRIFSFHHHAHAEAPGPGISWEHAHGDGDRPGHVCDHDRSHAQAASSHAHRLSWIGVCLGMGLHTLIDGLALGASVESDALEGLTNLCGIGTFLAVFLHKPLDSASITSLMAVGGWSPRARSVANGLFALICPIGAGLFALGVHEFSGYQSAIIGFALAASAGVFLTIALADLLPEMEFHSHNRVRLTAALFAGIVLGWAIHFLDPAHSHDHVHDEAARARPAARTDRRGFVRICGSRPSGRAMLRRPLTRAGSRHRSFRRGWPR